MQFHTSSLDILLRVAPALVFVSSKGKAFLVKSRESRIFGRKMVHILSVFLAWTASSSVVWRVVNGKLLCVVGDIYVALQSLSGVHCLWISSRDR